MCQVGLRPGAPLEQFRAEACLLAFLCCSSQSSKLYGDRCLGELLTIQRSGTALLLFYSIESPAADALRVGAYSRGRRSEAARAVYRAAGTRTVKRSGTPLRRSGSGASGRQRTGSQPRRSVLSSGAPASRHLQPALPNYALPPTGVQGFDFLRPYYTRAASLTCTRPAASEPSREGKCGNRSRHTSAKYFPAFSRCDARSERAVRLHRVFSWCKLDG